ncbi:hypothetical protein C7974DRAFT_439567 [Boeremia exigua]|uniref:uncharacterized protein n=1 Tax=Boeremia exigua TaxID=749465 RepID=UPI001E8E6457|nr:uncharacterized protein C7974DRAFT_439567 [Boeremia exigua]KAH6644272.1 hypothetical protein C7974DRAFT_439567 [Boeremia exigua]
MSGSQQISRGSESSTWSTGENSSAPLNASAPTFAPPQSQTQALETLLGAGTRRIYITAEREDAGASPDYPTFLKGVRFDPASNRRWYEDVLPYLSKCTFVVSSTADVIYSGNIFSSAALPHIYNAVTKMELPKFYWFSGVALNRHHNPYLQMCRNLPNLRDLSLTIHTAGLTNQRWAERQIAALEQKNPEAAKERILLPLREVVHRYQLDAVFTCGRLQRLRLEYIDSAMTAYFCKVGRPVDVVREVQSYLEQGFIKRGLQVEVELVRLEEGSRC